METIGCYVTSIVWKTLGVMLQVSYGKHWVLCYTYHVETLGVMLQVSYGKHWVLCYTYHLENIGCYVTSIIRKTLGVMLQVSYGKTQCEQNADFLTLKVVVSILITLVFRG